MLFNFATALDTGRTLGLHIGCQWPGATEAESWADSPRMKNRHEQYHA